MKTREELNALREEVEALSKKLAELTEEELKEVAGGLAPGRRYWYGMGNENGGFGPFGGSEE